MIRYKDDGTVDTSDWISIGHYAARWQTVAHELAHALDSAHARLRTAEAELERLRKDAERYWPYVEAVAKQRYPFTTMDEVEAMEMLRERKRNAIAQESKV